MFTSTIVGKKIERSEKERNVGEREIKEEEDMRDAGERKTKTKKTCKGEREKSIFFFKKKVKSKKYYFDAIENIKGIFYRVFFG